MVKKEQGLKGPDLVKVPRDTIRRLLFLEYYGHPLTWCEWYAGLEGELGVEHRKHLAHFEKLAPTKKP